MTNNIREEINDFPEMDYFLNEDKSDVIFIVEGQRLPALKAFLSVKSRVFRDIFDKNTDKEIVIEDTTFEAFKTLIHFLYFNQLFLDQGHKLGLEEARNVLILAEYYETPVIKDLKIKIKDRLTTNDQIFIDCEFSDETDWLCPLEVESHWPLCIDCPEIDYFMNESLSDVVFVIEGQRLPALKAFLCVKNRVFRAMFSGDFRESFAKEVVIEDTTFEAFKTFILFLYFDRLVLKDLNDFKIIENIIELSDRYEASGFAHKINQHLNTIELTSDNIESMAGIAFDYDDQDLKTKVMAFTDKHFEDIFEEIIIELNDCRLLKVLATNYRKVRTELNQIRDQLDLLNRGHCNYCGSINLVHPSHTGPVICKYGHQIGPVYLDGW